MKKVGIITFHNSYNCGSMLESFAIHTYLKKDGINNEIINFSNEGQREMYAVFNKNDSLKHIIKNLLVFPHRKKIKNNNLKYEEFKNKNFELSKEYIYSKQLDESMYSIVVAGSDQIWNITIKDKDDAYFLNWVKNARKVAYAPSFGARKISNYTTDVERYKKYLKDFDAISIRENNGQKWLKEMGILAPVLIDPTLLLDKNDYDKILDLTYTIPYKEYIFFYCPHFNKEICKFVKKIAKKYKLPVIAWSTKSYYLKGISRFGFELPEYESPAVYLKLIKNAKLIFTTSFHGTIFSTIYGKKFYTIKNGDMYGDDDRVLTLLNSLDLMTRCIPYDYDEKKDYFEDIDYTNYKNKLKELKQKAISFINDNIKKYYRDES